MSLMPFVKWLVVLTPAWLVGQTVSVDLSPPIQESGRAIALVQLVCQPGAEPAALQWTLRGGTAKPLQIEPGEQVSAAKKQITCSHSKGQTTCVIWGLNRNLIHNGIVAKVIAPGAGLHLRLSRISAASADGRSLAVERASESEDAPDANPSKGRVSAVLIGAALLVILVAVYLVRRRAVSRTISKRARVTRRSGSLP